MSVADVSRVSIVIPCYEMHGKGAEYLACALHSIFLQTWKEVEVVVADNAQDGSITQMVDRWRHLLPIVHIRPGTRRSTDTLNAGIRAATGDVVRILFQDDLLFGPDSLGQMMQEFHRGAQWCVGRHMHLIDGRLVRPLTPFASTAMAYQAVDKVVFTSPDLALNFGHRPRADEYWQPRREAWHLESDAGSGSWRPL